MPGIVHMSDMVSIALHSMVLIAAQEAELINAKKIASATGFSEAHLSKVLQRLVRAGYIRSLRGPKGGFTLTKRAEDITLLDIYEAIEGPITIDSTGVNCRTCPLKSCIFGGIPQHLNKEFFNYLKDKRLSDFSTK